MRTLKVRGLFYGKVVDLDDTFTAFPIYSNMKRNMLLAFFLSRRRAESRYSWLNMNNFGAPNASLEIQIYLLVSKKKYIRKS